MNRDGWWALDGSGRVRGMYLPGGQVRATLSGDRTWLWNIIVTADDGTVLDRFGVTRLDRAKTWAERLLAEYSTATNPGEVAA